ncbi:MAG: paraslipin [Actinobacteria bacterium]|nr:paraslipin [Actinomycetota bacterium]
MENIGPITTLIIVLVIIFTLFRGIKVVPQSKVFVVERFGKYYKTLNAGLSLIIPYLDSIAHRVDILERQLEAQKISVITKDNVEVDLETSVFYRVIDASRSVYRISNIDLALNTETSSVVRSAAGKLELDELQSSREQMNAEIAKSLSPSAEVWGIEITRTSITDVVVDDSTKAAQRQQLNAERNRRATVADAEGQKEAIQLKADGDLYKATKEAEAVKVAADAQAYSIEIKAAADAKQTQLLAQAIKDNGKPAVDFEIAKRQVDAIGQLTASQNTKTLILPSDISGIFSAFSALVETLPKEKK